MPEGWNATSLASIERISVPEEGVEWVPVRAHFGIRAFGVNAWTGDAGTDLIGPHDETDDFAGGHEELYLVVSGSATFTVGTREVDAPAGTLVFVRDPALKRSAVAHANHTMVVSIGSLPGAAFKVAAWEYLVRAGAYGRSRDLEAAIETIRAGLEVCPEGAELLYHLSCYESLAGRLDDARAHLAEALARDPSVQERAERDPDLAPLRDHDDPAIVGERA